MIWDSSYWKEPLLASAKWLLQMRLSERSSERTYARIEKELFLGFYSIRKLLDSQTISDSTKLLSFELRWHPNKKHVDLLNWHKLDELYDLTVSRTETRDILYLCNQFIHSYAFLPVEDAQRLIGFFVSSDRDRNRKVYFVELRHVLTAFRTVGRDYPSEVRFSRDPKTGDFGITAK